MLNATDEEVLSASLHNPSLFGIIVDRYQAQFLRAAYKIVNSIDDAQDVTQEAFIKIYRNGSRFTYVEGARFKSWGYKILINTAITHYNKNKRALTTQVSVDDELYAIQLAAPERDTDALFSGELYQGVRHVLSELPESVSDLLRKYYFEDRALKDIAREQRISLSAVKTRLMRARRYFKRALQKDEKLFLWIKNSLELNN